MKKVAVIAFLSLMTLYAPASWAAETLNGAGATFPYPVYSAWAYEYSKVSGMQLNYQSIGSGGGIKQITERTVSTPAHSSRAALYSTRNPISPAPPTGSSASAPTQTAIATSKGRRNSIFGRPCARRA